ncbi:MAG: hypothetical protein AAFN30_15905 [Actinomycetota bacterium]
MDPHVQWLRRRIRRSLIGQAVVVAVVGALATAGALTLAARPVSETVPWVLVGAQAALGALVAWSLFTNPLDLRYLSGHLATEPRFEAVVADDIDPAVVDVLAELRLRPLATIWDDGETPRPAHDLFQSARQTVTAAWSRNGGGLSLYTRLADGRILVTDSTIVVPSRSLVVNFAPGLGDDYYAEDLVALHQEALTELARWQLPARPDDGGLFLEVLATEHAAYQALGPMLACFFSPTGSRHRLRLSVTPDPGELLDLARFERRPRPSAGAVVAARAPRSSHGPTAGRYPPRDVRTPGSTKGDRGPVGAPGRSQPERPRGHRGGDHRHQPARHR